jgi:hypothetical protein
MVGAISPLLTQLRTSVTNLSISQCMHPEVTAEANEGRQ